MVTVVGCRQGARFQILEESVCISHGADTFSKSMNSTIQLPDIGKTYIVRQTWLFNFCMATNFGKGKL